MGVVQIKTNRIYMLQLLRRDAPAMFKVGKNRIKRNDFPGWTLVREWNGVSRLEKKILATIKANLEGFARLYDRRREFWECLPGVSDEIVRPLIISCVEFVLNQEKCTRGTVNTVTTRGGNRLEEIICKVALARVIKDPTELEQALIEYDPTRFGKEVSQNGQGTKGTYAHKVVSERAVKYWLEYDAQHRLVPSTSKQDLRRANKGKTKHIPIEQFKQLTNEVCCGAT